MPPAVRVPGVPPGDLPALEAPVSRRLAPGGERAGRELASAWLDGPLGGYAESRDELAADRTSRVSAYLRSGCVSPLELARAALLRPGGEARRAPRLPGPADRHRLRASWPARQV
jgi:deoxyribodipyrimidine photo-lyase